MRPSESRRTALRAETAPSSPLSPERWSAFLSAGLEAEVEVRFSEARRAVLRVERKRGRFLVRMQSFFSAAPGEIQQAVLSWLRSGKRARQATRTLDAWIDAELEALWRVDDLSETLCTRGRAHDLEPLARELLESEFSGELLSRGRAPCVTWGRAGRSRTRHSLRLGSYDYHARIVRIHPVLDQPGVPEWFVRYVLFHELLHAAMPARKAPGSKRVFHGPEFRRRERQYSDTLRAHAWEKRHLQALIASARTGRPLPPAKEPRGHQEHEKSRLDQPPRVARVRATKDKGWVQRLLF